MRIDRPVGTLLLLWPTLAAVVLAGRGEIDWRLISIFTIGTFVMRSAGCVVNDILDRNVDPYVQRTRNRPLARRAIGVGEAILLAAALLAIALLLAVQLKPVTLGWALAGGLIAIAYPLAKRVTYLPQVVLGVAFSWGILLAFVELHDAVPDTGWIMFIGSLLWIVAYDTFYALVDRKDDLQIGVRSTAVLFGEGAVAIIALLQICTLVVWYLVGYTAEFGLPYHVALIAIAGLFLHQQTMVRINPSLKGDHDTRQRRAYLRAFRSNTWVGFALLLGILGEYLLPGLQA